MEDLKISKELFNDVTNSKCHEVFIKNELVVAHSNLGMKMVNIYEFAFKCKEWAYKNRYDIWSITWGAVEFQNNDRYNGTERITEDTEIEAIIKACEWITTTKGK